MLDGLFGTPLRKIWSLINFLGDPPSQISQFSNATLSSKLHFCSNPFAHKLSIEPRPPNWRRRVAEAKEGLSPASCTLPQDVGVFGRNNQIREGGCLKRVQHPAQEASRFWGSEPRAKGGVNHPSNTLAQEVPPKPG